LYLKRCQRPVVTWTSIKNIEIYRYHFIINLLAHIRWQSNKCSRTKLLYCHQM